MLPPHEHLLKLCCNRSLLQFQQGGEGNYDVYQSKAGKMVMAQGGSVAFLGQVKVWVHPVATSLPHIVCHLRSFLRHHYGHSSRSYRPCWAKAARNKTSRISPVRCCSFAVSLTAWVKAYICAALACLLVALEDSMADTLWSASCQLWLCRLEVALMK